MSDFTSYVSALRESFKGIQGEPDMRAAAARAVDMLDHDKVLLAATTHLTQLARREWNRIVTEMDPAPASDEVVNVHGADVFLGDTSEDEREWLAQHRERLAAGLEARAADFRAFGPAGPAFDNLTTSQVLKAERQAAERAAAADALAHLLEHVGEGPRLLRQIEADTEAAHQRRELANEHTAFLMGFARRVANEDWLHPHCRRAAVRMVEILAVEPVEAAS